MCVDDIFLSVCMLLSSDGAPSSFPYVDGCEVDPSQRLMIAHSAEPIPPLCSSTTSPTTLSRSAFFSLISAGETEAETSTFYET